MSPLIIQSHFIFEGKSIIDCGNGYIIPLSLVIVIVVTVTLKWTSKKLSDRIPTDITSIDLFKDLDGMRSGNEANLAQEIELHQHQVPDGTHTNDGNTTH